jgi:hypothetical protein
MALPKLPKKTRINGVPWRVAARRSVHHEGVEVDGLCHFDQHLIEVAVGTEDELSILETYFHEVLHAIVHEAGVDIDDNTEHAIIKQAEKWLARNVDLRARPRAERRPPKAPSAQKRRRGPRA